MSTPSRPGWRKLSRVLLLQHPRLSVHEDTVKLPDDTFSQYALLPLPDAVTVVIEHKGKVLLNLEYAYPVDDRVHRPKDIASDGWIYKFPGGMLHQNETYEQAAIREVEEETGVRVQDVTLLAPVRNYFPRSNSLDYKVAATVGGAGTLRRSAEEATMEQVWKTPAEIDALIAKQGPRVLHSHFLDTWMLYQKRSTKK